ncbi:PepSY domain-containing protein [Neoroseomonas lacus]|uniref:PepSY domain-containing protein n=1 Tax=Neoroseomonas lacus TaxID=287609 RepID=A0A917KFP4_9PROT|nr:PepSY domain-containing protein [Neoroseomonas lacus]GGJ12305.1 hypothetical protein GCM10011320_19440 [Neoroseomonas lacus]
MTRILPASALALAIAAALPLAPAMASSDDSRRASAETLSRAAVDAAAAATAVRTAGYGPVRSVEWERTAWEVKALDAEGRRVELRVDAATGAVTRRDR